MDQRQSRIHRQGVTPMPVEVVELNAAEVESRVTAMASDPLWKEDEWMRLRSRSLTLPPNATVAVRGHPPGVGSTFRFLTNANRSPWGVGGHIGPSELRWPYMSKVRTPPQDAAGLSRWPHNNPHHFDRGRFK